MGRNKKNIFEKRILVMVTKPTGQYNYSLVNPVNEYTCIQLAEQLPLMDGTKNSTKDHKILVVQPTRALKIKKNKKIRKCLPSSMSTLILHLITG